MDDNLTGDLKSERIDNEKLFCACAFVNPQMALEKCSWIEKGDFYNDDLGKFWSGIKEHSDPMRAASDAHVLSELADSSTKLISSMHPDIYASEMKRLDYLLESSGVMCDIAQAISQRDENIVRDKVAKLHTLSPSVPSSSVSKPAEISAEFIRRINTQSMSLLTGIDDLDAILGGLFVGELTIMAGRPGIGKTAIATAIAQNISTLNNSAKVLFFSLEMDKIQLWARMACAKTSHSWKDIRSGRADRKSIDEVQAASHDLETELGDRLLIEDGVWDVPGMVSIASETKPDFVIVDHLSEIRWKNDIDEVKWFGRATKLLRTEISRRMHIPLLLIHQLNRGVEGRDNKRPQLSDLKWSGDLEAIADNVIMLFREDYYDDTNFNKPTTVPMEIWIRKNRQGVMNSCAVVNFDTSTQKFSPARTPPHITKRAPIDSIPHTWYDAGNE